MEFVRHGFEHSLKKLPCHIAFRFIYKLRHDELTGPVNGYKQISLTFVGAQFGDVEMEISIRLAFELVAVQIQQSRYSMPPPSSGVAKIASDAG